MSITGYNISADMDGVAQLDVFFDGGAGAVTHPANQTALIGLGTRHEINSVAECSVGAYLVSTTGGPNPNAVRFVRQTAVAGELKVSISVLTSPNFKVYHFANDAQAPWANSDFSTFSNTATSTSQGWNRDKTVPIALGAKISSAGDTTKDHRYDLEILNSGDLKAVNGGGSIDHIYCNLLEYSGWDVEHLTFPASGLTGFVDLQTAHPSAELALFSSGTDTASNEMRAVWDYTYDDTLGRINGTREWDSAAAVSHISAAHFTDGSIVTRELFGGTTGSYDMTVPTLPANTARAHTGLHSASHNLGSRNSTVSIRWKFVAFTGNYTTATNLQLTRALVWANNFHISAQDVIFTATTPFPGSSTSRPKQAHRLLNV